MRDSIIAYIKVLIGWSMTIIPAWLDELNTVIGAASATGGFVVIFWTARNQIIKYKIQKLELKRKQKEDEVNF